MTTERQIEANRKNALLSTGPKTPEGKAIVRCNAIQHGILTEHVYVNDDMKGAFLRLKEEFYQEFQPRGSLEHFLLDRVISCAWRLSLITKIEAEVLQSEASWGEPQQIKGAFEGMSCDNMAVISRYENAIERAFYRALGQFKQMQLNRTGALVEIGFVS